MEFIVIILIFFVIVVLMAGRGASSNTKKSLEDVHELFQYLGDHFDELPKHVQDKIDETGQKIKARDAL